MAEQTKSGDEAPRGGMGGARRVLWIVLAVFGLAVAGIAVAAWFAGDGSDLQMEYEGFD